MVLQAIKYERGKLEILDQLRLPHEEIYVPIQNPQDGWNAIKVMQVRGAPAIAIVAVLSLAVSLIREDAHLHDIPTANAISLSLKFLVTSRPTAVNLLDAAKKLERVAYDAQAKSKSDSSTVIEAYARAAEQMLDDDVRDNENIGRHGADWIQNHYQKLSSNQRTSVITHCNTGSLATAGFGTALGVIRRLHSRGSLSKVFYTETRPYNQGARLTGFELIHDRIPAELITDSMAAALLKVRGRIDNISCIVVGADRVARNGDTANKIGTYSLAVLARFHGIKFLVAAPRTTIDLATPNGSSIKIEQRPMNEVTTLKAPEIQHANNGSVAYGPVKEIDVAAAGTQAWNPAFDVTEAELIDGIITEKGVVEKGPDGRFHFDSIFKAQYQDGNGDAMNNASLHESTKDRSPLNWSKVLDLKADQVKSWKSWMEQYGRV